jgi:glutamyl aminopeptidase
VHFNTSVKMVTYLACFIVCDFQYKELTTNDGVKFRVYARPEQLEATTYAVNLGTNISNFFVDYFGVEYPLPKQG